MLSKVRLVIALTFSAFFLLASLYLLGVEGAVAFKEKMYFLNGLLVPIIGISLHIKNKVDALSGTSGLSSKDMTKITGHASKFTARIWSLWFFYFLAFASSIVVALTPLSESNSMVGVSFTIGLFALCIIASVSLYSTDQAVQVLSIHLKARAIKSEEKKRAIELLKSEDELPESFKEYLKKKIESK
ncbi:TPA: hypothetical protein ACGU2D_001621 [Vibrio vulnificus]|nr:hypothetical protein [Vibrio vulnificus]